MAKPIPADLDLRHLSRDIKPDGIYDAAVNKFSKGNGRSSKPVQPVLPTTDDRQLQTTEVPQVSSASTLTLPTSLSTSILQNAPSAIPIATIQPMQKSSEPPKSSDESVHLYPEKPTFIPPKPVSQSPKISPSSIPNPSPSATTTKPLQLGYANYGSYMYSMPVYSAFQPVQYPVLAQPSTQIKTNSEQLTATEIVHPTIQAKGVTFTTTESKISEQTTEAPDEGKSQTDFEEQFTPKVVPAAPTETCGPDLLNTNTSHEENKNDTINLTNSSLAINNDSNKKAAEKLSLKTSIPISKIDMKCVTNPAESIKSPLLKRPFSSAFHALKAETPKIEIQSNVLINEPIMKEVPVSTNSIGTLITAAEVINQAETFRKPDPKPESELVQNKDQSCMKPPNNMPPRSIFNPINLEPSNPKFSSPTQETPNDQKNHILLIKNNSNPKMLLAIQQQNPQTIHQKSNIIDQKNLQAPSRPSSQAMKCKELVSENGTSSKVVSLKRMHQDDCDENDFENLITENQIYGNKIVVKEKSQGTLQEQEIINKSEKIMQPPSKPVVLQPNFVYLSNVQFPANVMMFKNNLTLNEGNQTALDDKPNLDINKSSTITDNMANITCPSTKQENKDMNILRTSLTTQKCPSNNSKTDVVFQQPTSKLFMNPQIVYKVPMIIDRGNSRGSRPIEASKEGNTLENPKPNEKVIITCQMDSKLQPKFLITSLRPKVSVTEEISALDIYEKRKRSKRLKYLTSRDIKDSKKTSNLPEESENSIITSENMKVEMYNELLCRKSDSQDIESGSEYEDNDMDYDKIIEEYKTKPSYRQEKRAFLSNFSLATHKDYKDREWDRRERTLRKDAIASAYITAGRIDCLSAEYNPKNIKTDLNETIKLTFLEETGKRQQRKEKFLARLRLVSVPTMIRDGYEKIWHEVIKERKRRDRPLEHSEIKQRRLDMKMDTSGQLKLISEIKNHVNENNNLIKKKLDSYSDAGDSIKVLAEKNFSELNRLSKMADISVQHFSGHEEKKRDLNPGFDSENIQTKPHYTHINVPNIYKTRVKEVPEVGIPEKEKDEGRTKDAGCQASESIWSGVEAFIKGYKEYDAARKREIADLNRRNTSLRVESAYVTRNASRDSDRTKALLAERQHLAREEAAVRQSIQRIYAALEGIRRCQVET